MPIHIAADGARLHHDVLGDPGRPPLVVLAGGPARHPDYLGDLAGLGGPAGRRRLVVPHLRGVGRSPAGPAEAMSHWAQASDVVALLDHLGLDRAVLLGHSAGCRLTLATAVQHPQRVAALVLVTPPGAPFVAADDIDGLVAARRGDPVFDAAVAACLEPREVADDDAYTAWQHEMAPTTYAAWGEAERAHALSGRWSLAAARAFGAPAPDGAWDGLAQVDVPVLVVVGDADCATGADAGRGLAALVPRGRVEVLAGCGHYPWVEQPAAFRVVVDGFLDGVGPV